MQNTFGALWSIFSKMRLQTCKVIGSEKYITQSYIQGVTINVISETTVYSMKEEEDEHPISIIWAIWLQRSNTL